MYRLITAVAFAATFMFTGPSWATNTFDEDLAQIDQALKNNPTKALRHGPISVWLTTAAWLLVSRAMRATLLASASGALVWSAVLRTALVCLPHARLV